MTALTLDSASPWQARIESICTVFSGSPRLRAVATQRAQAWLDRQFATLNLSADTLAVGTPEGTYTRLPDVLLERLASGQPVLYTEGYHRVDKRARENYLPTGLVLAQVEGMVNQQGPFLLLAWREAWQTWWQREVVGKATRFVSLADALLELMYESPKPAGMTHQRFSALFPRHGVRASQPVRGAGVQVRTLHVRRQDAPASEPAQMLPLLVLGSETPTLLLFSPATGVRALERLEDALGLIPDALSAQALEWFALEPLDDPFTLLAAACADGQRREIEAITPSAARTPGQLQALLDHILDPRRWFAATLTPAQQRLQHALPLWLTHADDQDITAYTRHLTALAVVQHEAAGRDFLEGIAPIERFAANALQACLDAEPNAAGVRVDDITLTFTRVAGAGMPGGFAVGEVEHLSLSLTQLALENLSGFAHSPITIVLKGRPTPATLTYALLKACVTQVDIGQRYPDLLKRTFITDTVEATRRERLFVAQLRAQLPLLALEQKIKREHGLTASGYRLLAAGVQATATAALWPLAFKARPGDGADVAVNMYVIGPRDGTGGPHLLYRPLLQPALQEYASQEALFAAIKAPGPVQDSVLDWLAPTRRHVYANGGFAEPHIAQMFQGDEFTPPSRPAPAQLSKQTVTGDPLHQVFVGTVQALVTLADAQSISNAQARWATLKAGGWLLFGTLLPLVTGPVGLAGWLFQLMASVQQDSTVLADADSPDASQATVDLLVNLALVLAHHLSPHGVSEHSRLEPAAPTAPRHVVPATRALINTRPSGWFSGTDVLSPALQARLEGMSLNPEAAKGTLEARGALKGLFRDGAQWQADVRGRRYRVQARHASVRVVSADGDTLGPWLKRLADDRWDIDLRLRLVGGNADEAIAERQRAEADSVPVLTAELARIRAQVESADRAINIARGLIDNRVASEAQRTAAHDRFVQELKGKLNNVLLEVQVLKSLRAKGPRRGYEAELCSTLESLILTEQLLTVQMRTQTARVHAVLGPALERTEAVDDDAVMTEDERKDHQAIVDGLRRLAEINDNAIRWRAMENRHLQELKAVPRFGRDKAEALTLSAGTQPSVLDLQALQVTTLWGLALDSSRAKVDDVFFQELHKVVERVRWATRSHASLEHLAQASGAERIELLESITRVYAETYDSFEFWREVEAEHFNAEFLDQLQQLLTRLNYEAELQLTDLLSAVPTPVPTRGRARQKIIRMRNQDMLVATLREPSADALGEVAELKDDKEVVIASFTQADDGVWEQVQMPTARVAPMPALSRLLDQGQTLLGQVEPAISKVLRQASTANEPQSLQDILEHQANTLRECAKAINQRLLQEDVARLAATTRARAQTRAHELTAAASRLVEQGLQARVSAVKARPPTQAGIDFLSRHDEVRICRMEDRVALKGKRNDFLQVYGVFDANDHQALCYAHFHYETAQAFNDHFTAAHLKTPEQHRLGKQAQAQVQAQAFARIQAGQSGRAQPALAIHRSGINLRMARRLFFDAPLWTGRW